MRGVYTKLFLFVCIAGMLVLTSCTGGYSGSGSRDINYRSGSQALEMKFLPSSGDFFEGDELFLPVEFYNRGTADITNGEFFVSGYDLTYLTLMLDPKYIDIEGKDEFDPAGERSQILTIRANDARMPSNSEEFIQTIKLTACYDYATLATAEICVDPDPHGRRQTDKTCIMGPVSPGSQGAPIVVSRVTPYVSRNDFRLDIEITNAGDGVVFDRQLSNEECFAALDKYKDVDKVDLTRIEFSGRQMVCTPNNPIRLVNGVGKIICECKGCIQDYMDTYTTQIVMEFAYGYRNEDFKTVRLLKE